MIIPHNFFVRWISLCPHTCPLATVFGQVIMDYRLIVSFVCLQADQLTEEQIAGKIGSHQQWLLQQEIAGDIFPHPCLKILQGLYMCKLIFNNINRLFPKYPTINSFIPSCRIQPGWSIVTNCFTICSVQCIDPTLTMNVPSVTLAQGCQFSMSLATQWLHPCCESRLTKVVMQHLPRI